MAAKGLNAGRGQTKGGETVAGRGVEITCLVRLPFVPEARRDKFALVLLCVFDIQVLET